jgi:parallel beta-helix repeat protein
MGEFLFKRWGFILTVLFILFSCAFIVSSANHPSYSKFSSAESGLKFDNDIISVFDTAIYKTGYYSINGGVWQSFNLTGQEYTLGGNWLRGSSSKQFTNFGEGEHYVIIYSCNYTNSWNCHGNKWQLIVINNVINTTVNNTINNTNNSSTNFSGMKYLVENGAGRAEIIISPTAPSAVKIAADEFQYYVNKISGATLPIVHTINAGVPIHVYIGRSNYTDAMGITSEGCEYGGFKMVSGENYLVLIGDDKLMDIPGPHYGPPDWKSTSTLNAEWYDLTGKAWANDYISSYYRRYNSNYKIFKGDSRGSMNAVYEFLHAQGARWYFPGAIGEVVPVKSSIGFSSMNILKNPDFAMRDYFFYSFRFNEATDDQLKWQFRLRNNGIEEVMTLMHAHGLNAITSSAQTKSEHPEYYAIWSGVRMNGSNIKQDLCSEALFWENVLYAKTMFDVYDVPMVSVGPADGFTQASESTPECKSRETPQRGEYGSLSDYVWEYVNNVAWEIYNDPNYAGKKIFSGAYGRYTLPPLDLSKEVAPNLVVRIARTKSNDYSNQEEKAFYMNLVNEWIDFLPSKEIYTYDFYLHNRPDTPTQSIPYIFPHAISEDSKFLKGKSRGEATEVATNYGFMNLSWDIFAAESLNVYVTSRLYWNASEDIDSLLEEYYTLYYGPAREKMKEFFEYTEQHYFEALYDPVVLISMRKKATEARAIAGNTLYGERIDLLLDLINSNFIGEEVVINSCQTLDSPTTTYKLSSDVSSSGTCFKINTVGVTLDCQGNSIFYGGNSGSNQHGIDIEGASFYNITNCIIGNSNSASSGNAIYSHGDHGRNSNNGFIYNNGIYLTGSNTGIHIMGNPNVSIQKNIVNSNSGALYVNGLIDGIIADNKLNSVSNTGLYSFNANNVMVRNNIISSNSNNGVYIFKSNKNTFSNNTINTNSTIAFFISTNSTYNLFNDNKVTSRDSSAIRFYSGSNNNQFYSQTALGGTYGVDIASSSNNIFRDCVQITGNTRNVNIGSGSASNTFVNCVY